MNFYPEHIKNVYNYNRKINEPMHNRFCSKASSKIYLLQINTEKDAPWTLGKCKSEYELTLHITGKAIIKIDRSKHWEVVEQLEPSSVSLLVGM